MVPTSGSASSSTSPSSFRRDSDSSSVHSVDLADLSIAGSVYRHRYRRVRRLSSDVLSAADAGDDAGGRRGPPISFASRSSPATEMEVPEVAVTSPGGGKAGDQHDEEKKVIKS